MRYIQHHFICLDCKWFYVSAGVIFILLVTFMPSFSYQDQALKSKRVKILASIQKRCSHIIF